MSLQASRSTSAFSRLECAASRKPAGLKRGRFTVSRAAAADAKVEYKPNADTKVCPLLREQPHGVPLALYAEALG